MKKIIQQTIAGLMSLSAMTAVAYGSELDSLPMEAGSYLGKANKQYKVGLMVRPIPGRESSFMAVLYKEDKEAKAYMVDPLIVGVSYSMTPLEVTEDGELGHTNDQPSLVLSIRGDSKKDDPKFTISNSLGGNVQGFQGSIEFNGRDFGMQWEENILSGRYRLNARKFKNAATIGIASHEYGDPSQMAIMEFTIANRKANTTEVREKAPGLYLVRDIRVTNEGMTVSSMPYRIGFFTDPRCVYKDRFVLVNPADYTDVYDLSLRD